MRPYRLDEHLTLRGWFPPEPRTFFEYPDDKGRFSRRVPVRGGREVPRR